ncbi:hypothetical protein SODALDRAFT_376997 [Sodiomyces alkalinus F11]|uniref:Rhodopsin domain-containing protein n=1 Tax=Sodiomyces alkalinus (strain CBS 110278 / VKM F-3762 / F11) TaxID=1314773 RepID=A0A3N2Q3G0_SODAK|nr:hypothetical protein SODALDRAFT_376997 [Sodiomyces alkalinus F11]ROT41304.1 hypothetical protein SODALDRAFT_376997 [Sodiomyces alkalinus F11]
MFSIYEREPRPWHLTPRDDAYLVDPPPGQTRRYGSDRETLAPALIAFGAVVTVAAGVIVALRFFTRTHVVRNTVSVDDYLALLSLIFSISRFAFFIQLTTLGLGNHMWDVPLSDYSPWFLLYTVCATITYSLSVSFSKLSILAFYLRLSPARWFRLLVWALMGAISAYSVAYVLISIFTSAAPQSGLAGTSPLTSYMVLSVANIVMDVCTLALPIPVVAPLQMARRQKLSLLLLFATGVLVCAIAIRRTVILPPLMASPDYTWEAVEQFYWSFGEVNVGILCAAAPALKPFVMRYLPALLRSSLSGSGGKASKMSHSHGMGGNLGNSMGDETKQQRRGMQERSYELHSLSRDNTSDDVEDEGGFKKTHGWTSADEDEAELWSGNPNRRDHLGDGRAAGGHRKSDVENSSLESLEEAGLPRAHAVTVTGGQPPSRTTRNTTGINITQETTVDFSSR